ncbi:EntF family bacteriocin induction factor [Trichococcus flocculiformis]|jgi:hypothetical protein|nr:EntF family bacteriocin induction factor [Trichococcus flocculiformis]
MRIRHISDEHLKKIIAGGGLSSSGKSRSSVAQCIFSFFKKC